MQKKNKKKKTTILDLLKQIHMDEDLKFGFCLARTP